MGSCCKLRLSLTGEPLGDHVERILELCHQKMGWLEHLPTCSPPPLVEGLTLNWVEVSP